MQAAQADLSRCRTHGLDCARPAELRASSDRRAVQVLLLVEGGQPIHAAELPTVRHHVLCSLAELDRALAPALPFPRSGFIGTLAAEIRMHEKGHIQGHRYALVDGRTAAAACAGTPLSKLQTATSTTCQASLSLAWHDCRRHLAMERARRRRELQGRCNGEELAGPSGAASAGAGKAGEAQEVKDAEGSGGQDGAAAVAVPAEGGVGTSSIDRADAEGASNGERDEGGGGSGAGAQRGECVGTAQEEPAVRMELLAQAPNRKWIAARWSLGGELVHVDDVATRDRNSLASANRNVHGMLSTYFPGVMGL